MTVSELAEKLQLNVFALPDPSRKVSGGYAGDLLSWVMGRAQPGQVWLTIMSNRNIVAVATLADSSAVILTEDVPPDEEGAERALERGGNLLGASGSTFDLAARIASVL